LLVIEKSYVITQKKIVIGIDGYRKGCGHGEEGRDGMVKKKTPPAKVQMGGDISRDKKDRGFYRDRWELSQSDWDSP